MDITPNLELPFILPSQAQKHVTHNEALRRLDAVVHLAVAGRDLASPPAEPEDGERHIVAADAAGEWTGHTGQIAAFQDGAWTFYPPGEGWIAWVAGEETALVFDGSAWAGFTGLKSVNPTPLVGVNATADAINRLAVKSDAVLLSHDDATPGTGDMRLKPFGAPRPQPRLPLSSHEYWWAVWNGTADDDRAVQIVEATAALALMTIAKAGPDRFGYWHEKAGQLWKNRIQWH